MSVLKRFRLEGFYSHLILQFGKFLSILKTSGMIIKWFSHQLCSGTIIYPNEIVDL